MAADPGGLDHAAAGGAGRRRHWAANVSGSRLRSRSRTSRSTLRVEHVADVTAMNLSIADRKLFVLFRNCRQAQEGPLIGPAQ